MSGAQRSSPAVNGSVKARAATQLQFNAPVSRPQHAAAAANRSPKASPTKQRQAQVQRPAGSSLNARLGRTPGAQSGSDKHGGQVNGRIAGSGSAPAHRQPRRINPQQLQQPAAPAGQVLRPGLGGWPSPAAQSPVTSRAGSAAWPQLSAGLPPAGPSPTALSAAVGSMQTAHSLHTVPAAAHSAAAAATAEADEGAEADCVQSSAPAGTAGGTAAQAATSAAAPEAVDEAERLRQAGRLGTLYGKPLRGCSSVALAPELNLLLRLLALPAGLQVGAGALRPVLLDSAAAAAAFASAALLQTGASLRISLPVCKLPWRPMQWCDMRRRNSQQRPAN